MLRIELVKSIIGQKKSNRLIVHSLGLRRMHQVVEHPDNPSIRGMVHHVKHMLSVQEVADAEPKKAKATKAAPAVAEAPKEEKPKRAKKATASSTAEESKE